MRNYKGIQTKIEQLGKYGCYLLSIAAQFDYDGDLVELYDVLLEKKLIDEECTVLDPEKIAYLVSGKKYEVSKVTELPTNLKDGDFYIECWYNPRTRYTHFKLPENDTLKSSVTVKEGKVQSYRLFREKK